MTPFITIVGGVLAALGIFFTFCIVPLFTISMLLFYFEYSILGFIFLAWSLLCA